MSTRSQYTTRTSLRHHHTANPHPRTQRPPHPRQHRLIKTEPPPTHHHLHSNHHYPTTPNHSLHQPRTHRHCPHPPHHCQLHHFHCARTQHLHYHCPTSHHRTHKIGRASCRERVCQNVLISVVAVSLKKNKEKKYTTQKKQNKRVT